MNETGMGARVVGAMGIGALLKVFVAAAIPIAILHEDLHGVGFSLEFLGGLYAIVLAFIIYAVWDQFNRVQLGLALEAAALEDLCRVASYLSDRGAFSKIKGATNDYIDRTVKDEPGKLAVGELSKMAEEGFGDLCDSIRRLDIQSAKDQTTYDELLRALSRVSDARDGRLSVSGTRIPSTLWGLVIFASGALLFTFLMLGLNSIALSAALVASASGTITFLLSVVKDLDNPFRGTWNVSYKGLAAIQARIRLL